MDEERRLEFHEILVEILGSANVYYQPPASVRMSYPCIVYALDRVDIRHADNKNYTEGIRYQVKYISEAPDADVLRKLRELKYCSFDRRYTADNLYHDVYMIYY